MKVDLFTKVILTIIAAVLVVIAARPLAGPKTGFAQARDEVAYRHVHFVEGARLLPQSGVSVQLVVDMRNGNVWGFPNVDAAPLYIGRYRFEAMNAPPPR